jgi:hypothetical protein
MGGTWATSGSRGTSWEDNKNTVEVWGLVADSEHGFRRNGRNFLTIFVTVSF